MNFISICMSYTMDNVSLLMNVFNIGVFQASLCWYGDLHVVTYDVCTKIKGVFLDH